jgi:hypothetical protein
VDPGHGVTSGEFTDDSGLHTSIELICEGNVLTNSISSSQIPTSWILLDNQSTIDVFCNDKLLTDIRRVTESMSIYCNAGMKTTSLKGMLQGYGEVWYLPTGIANILSLSRVREKGFVVVYDDDKNCFMLTRNMEEKIVFKQSERGLYFYDTDETQKHGNLFVVNTVAHNKSKFSHRDVIRATEARKLLCKIGRPSQQTFLRIIDRNLLPNCPITRRDAMNAQLIFGPDVGSLKGKTV